MQQRTIEYCAEKDSSERFLVPEILRGQDLWGVRMIEPEYFRRVRHGSDGVTGLVDPSERGGVREWGGDETGKVQCARSACYKYWKVQFCICGAW